MAWTQVYTPVASSVAASALCAAIPLFVLFYMLAVKQAKGHISALVGLVAALIVAIAVWGMPVSLAASATLNGACFGLFPIIWIVITAVWIYNMTVESGDFEVIKYSLASLTNDRRLQALFIAFAFSSFIEGTAGFGTPAAIAAAMLMGLGFPVLWAGGVALLANTAPVAFGAIGIPIIVASQVSGCDVLTVSGLAGIELSILALIVPFWVCVAMSGFKRAMEVLPAIIVAGGAFAAVEFVLATYHGPTVVDVCASIASIVALVLLLRVWKPRNVFVFEGEKAVEVESGKYTFGEILRSWSPYLILAVLVFLWGLGSVKSALNGIPGAIFKFGWPGLDGEVLKTMPIAPEGTVYGAKYTFNWLSAGGTAIFIAGLVSIPMLQKYSFGKGIACFFRTLRQLIFPIITISSVLGLAFVMNYSGMSSTLGIAFTHTGSLFRKRSFNRILAPNTAVT